MRYARLLTAATAALSLTGCAGGDVSPSVDCQNACARQNKCHITAAPFCRDDCADRATGLLPDFRSSYMSCYADLDCNQSDQSCVVEASSSTEVRDVDMTYVAQCQDKQTECQSGFDSDLCFLSRYYQPDLVQESLTCFTMTCNAVETCLDNELPFAPFGY